MNLLIRPLQTEKAFQAITKNTYLFLVPKGSSKQSIKATIEGQYQVTVVSIRTLVRKGKSARFSRGKRAYPGTTQRQDKHFAYVTLKAGDKIKVFDEEPTTETKTTAKTTDPKAKAAESETTTTPKATDEKQSIKTKKVGFFAKRRTGRRGDK